MNRLTLKEIDWQQLLVTLHQRLPVKTLTRLACLFLVILIAWLAARLSWSLWLQFTPSPALLTAAPAPTGASSAPSPSLAQLQNAALFGRYQAQAEVAAVQPVLTDAPQTSLNLKLTGVVATKQKPEQGTAIIENNGVEQVYAIDEQIEGTGAVLKQVLEDRVLLQVSGRFETLMLDGVEYQQLSDENAAVGTATVADIGPEPVASVHAEIAQMRSEMLAEPGKFSDYIRVTPRHRNGQIYGYALTPGKNPELFTRIGLMPNDVAIEINGVRLNDMQQAYGVFNELREAKEASIKVERDGEIKDVLFSLSQ
jgi:general secretion pathway protein C